MKKVSYFMAWVFVITHSFRGWGMVHEAGICIARNLLLIMAYMIVCCMHLLSIPFLLLMPLINILLSPLTAKMTQNKLNKED